MKVLIGYDGSVYADSAIDDLRRAGLPRVGDALIVTVGKVFLTLSLASHGILGEAVTTHRVTPMIELFQDQEIQALQEARRIASKAARLVEERLLEWKVMPTALAGSPSQELLREAELLTADDLIVIGSHGRSELGRLLLGSVSKRVASEVNSSVRITRRAMG